MRRTKLEIGVSGSIELLIQSNEPPLAVKAIVGHGVEKCIQVCYFDKRNNIISKVKIK